MASERLGDDWTSLKEPGSTSIETDTEIPTLLDDVESNFSSDNFSDKSNKGTSDEIVELPETLTAEQKMEALAKEDLKLYEILNKLQELQDKRTLLNQQLKSGYFELGKTKYLIGPERLTLLQYDLNMKASLTIEQPEEQTPGSHENTVYNRKTRQEDQPKNESSSPVRKPIHWFGALSPAPLVKAEKDFKSALELVIEIHNLSLELNLLL